MCGELEAREGVHHDDPDYIPGLCMLFYAGDLGGPLLSLIAENLKFHRGRTTGLPLRCQRDVGLLPFGLLFRASRT
jgi:hypothetical protein